MRGLEVRQRRALPRHEDTGLPAFAGNDVLNVMGAERLLLLGLVILGHLPPRLLLHPALPQIGAQLLGQPCFPLGGGLGFGGGWFGGGHGLP